MSDRCILGHGVNCICREARRGGEEIETVNGDGIVLWAQVIEEFVVTTVDVIVAVGEIALRIEVLFVYRRE